MKVRVNEYTRIGEREVPWYNFKVLNLSDGKEVKGVIWCDDSVGTLEKIVFDEEGYPYIEDKTDRVKTEIVTGNFKIEEVK
jgi:hypothetical protein